MLTEVGFVDIEIGPPVDTFGGATGEANARTFEVYGLRLPRPQTMTTNPSAGPLLKPTLEQRRRMT